jgi:hypothetical protein
MNKTLSHSNEFYRLRKFELKTFRVSENGLKSIILFIIGSFLNIIAYSSLEPFLVGLIFLLSCYSILRLIKATGKFELQALMITFSTCWLWAGVAAIYANYLNDPSQNILDAADFYKLVSGNTIAKLNILDISSMLENAAAIIVWKTFYNIFDFLGFTNGRFIGISVNISFIAFSAVIGIGMVKKIFGVDESRIRRFIKIFWLCPVFWYFASVHIRDAVILFSVSLLGLIWIIYLKDSKFINLIKLTLSTIISFFIFGLLRTEFLFVPLAMLFCGLFALLFGRSSDRVKIVIVFILIAGFFSASLFSKMQSNLYEKMTYGYESYNALTMAESGDSSLGSRFIVSSSIPIRLFFGAIYLFIFPIPFWIGFQLVNVAHLFKSLNALFMYGITPLFILAGWQIFQQKRKRSAPIVFLLFLSIGFTIAVAFTSLETRHFAAFLLPILIVSLLPDLSQNKDRTIYLKLLKWFIGIMTLLHLAWIIIKFN